jgi:hypothetical protein
MIAAASVINNRDTAIADDIIAVQYLPGCQNKRDRILNLIHEKIEQLRSHLTLEEVEEGIQLVRELFDNQLTLPDLKHLYENVTQFEAKLGTEMFSISNRQYSTLCSRLTTLAETVTI